MPEPKNVQVILVKSNTCHYCQRFEPVYEYSRNNIKSLANKYGLTYSTFDVQNDIDRIKLNAEHPECSKIMSGDKMGVPTVFINVSENGKSKYHIVEHVIPDDDSPTDIKNSSNKFMDNVHNKLKTIESDGKIEYIHTGGDLGLELDRNLDRKLYKEKYLKYKEKYMSLKLKLKNK